MSTRIFFMYVAALLLAIASMQANAAVKRADCRYWLVDVQTSQTPAPNSPWTNPTGFALILATTQHDLLAYASAPIHSTDSDDYIQAIERMLRRSVRP